VARATLGNERVTIGSRKNENRSALQLLALADVHRPGDAAVDRDVARLIAEEQARRALGIRHITRSIAGGAPGPEANVAKLLAGEHTQRVAKLGLDILGPNAQLPEHEVLRELYLYSRCLTIAGGTSEIVRNLIAERMLGLPRG
jgi:alkylation response protein AidB-like acyl-CoA dehydrogenase